MVKFPSLSERLGVTREKLVLVVVLASVLVGMLYLQFGGKDKEQGAASGERGAGSREQGTGSREQGADARTSDDVTPVDEEIEDLGIDHEASLDERLWGAPRLARVIEYDPFALPAKFPRPAFATAESEATVEDSKISTQEQLATLVEELQMQLEELRQRGVHVIVRQRDGSHDGYVAMIGDRTVHVGDEINGFTVTSIELNGVRVERKVPE